jgi:site-specific DNA recombinase
MNVAIYVRVSKNSQTYEQQVDACFKFCEYKGFVVGDIYKDVGSGKAYHDRPAFVRLLNDLREGKYRVVIVVRLDRLFRNATEALNIFQEWDNRGIEVCSLFEGLDASTPVGRAMRSMILVLAQLERENISEATRERLAILKDMGKKLGRHAISDYQLKKIVELKAQGLSVREISKQMDVSKSTVAKYCRSNCPQIDPPSETATFRGKI